MTSDDVISTCTFTGDGSTHPADPWASNGGAGPGAPLQAGPYGSYGSQQQQQQAQPQQQQQVGPTPPLMNSGASGAGPNTHMGQQPSYPGQGIFGNDSSRLNDESTNCY